MAKVLMTDFEKCTGCRLCELVCSVKHEGASNPARSRIKVVKQEWEGGYVPLSCQQCLEAPCLAVCPARAISRDESLNRVVIDYDRCIKCRMCVAVCPFGAIGFDTVAEKVIKCDLCDGDPECAKFCQPKAVQYVDATTISTVKKRATTEKLPGILEKIAPAIASIREGR